MCRVDADGFSWYMRQVSSVEHASPPLPKKSKSCHVQLVFTGYIHVHGVGVFCRVVMYLKQQKQQEIRLRRCSCRQGSCVPHEVVKDLFCCRTRD